MLGSLLFFIYIRSWVTSPSARVLNPSSVLTAPTCVSRHSSFSLSKISTRVCAWISDLKCPEPESASPNSASLLLLESKWQTHLFNGFGPQIWKSSLTPLSNPHPIYYPFLTVWPSAEPESGHCPLPLDPACPTHSILSHLHHCLLTGTLTSSLPLLWSILYPAARVTILKLKSHVSLLLKIFLWLSILVEEKAKILTIVYRPYVV